MTTTHYVWIDDAANIYTTLYEPIDGTVLCVIEVEHEDGRAIIRDHEGRVLKD